jgi:hypothetical protein
MVSQIYLACNIFSIFSNGVNGSIGALSELYALMLYEQEAGSYAIRTGSGLGWAHGEIILI